MSQLCSKCRKSIDRAVKYCPFCGHDQSYESKPSSTNKFKLNYRVFIVIVIAILLLIASPYIYGALSTYETINSARSLNESQKYDEALSKLDSIKNNFRFSFQDNEYRALVKEVDANRQLQASQSIEAKADQAINILTAQPIIQKTEEKPKVTTKPKSSKAPAIAPNPTAPVITQDPSQLPPSARNNTNDDEARTADGVVARVEARASTEDAKAYLERVKTMADLVKKGHATIIIGWNSLYTDSTGYYAQTKFVEASNYYINASTALKNGPVPTEFFSLHNNTLLAVSNFTNRALALRSGTGVRGFDDDELAKSVVYLKDANFYMDLAATQ